MLEIREIDNMQNTSIKLVLCVLHRHTLRVAAQRGRELVAGGLRLITQVWRAQRCASNEQRVIFVTPSNKPLFVSLLFYVLCV